MALQMYLGCCGSGKSHRLYKHIIEESLKHPELTYIILVPEQYNLSTQQRLISMHPKKGMLNIDVLSFTRLAHRVFEEVGYSHARGATIDDIGKNLILRHMAGRNEDKLTALKGTFDKLGYISEVKSVISEFMQYGIGDKELEGLIEMSEGRGILKAKLTDIKLLYSEFLKYINEKYITTEEILQKVSGEVPSSKKLKKSVVVLDGYTGFTPVQRGLIEALLVNCVDVYISLIMDTSFRDVNNDFGSVGEEDLFYLSRKTLASLESICRERGVARKEDVIIRDEIPARFIYDDTGETIPEEKRRQELIHLEKWLFRPGEKSVCGSTEDGSIHIFTGTMPDEEAIETAVRIERLVRDRGYHYKDIAVVTGDLGTYMNACGRAFARYDIPFFVDKTAPVMLNPLIEYIRALFDIQINDFSYEAMFRYLRTSICGYERAQVDELENYVLRYGIRGRKTWNEVFARKPKDMMADELEGINEIRSAVACELDSFISQLTGSVTDTSEAVYDVKAVSTALYNYINEHKLQAKMNELSAFFDEAGDKVRAMEYGRIYEEVCDLLNKMVMLLPGEKISLKEYRNLLDAGFAEIRTGVLPGSDDYVQIGDITRTRLRDVKAIFFMGVNDGIIPAAGGNGGIISDIEREFLTDSSDKAGRKTELAPTARMKAYEQRLYLYMLTSKPKEELFVSYSRLSTDGDSINPSYFVRQLTGMFPHLKAERPDDSAGNRVYGYKSAGDYLAGGLQDQLGMITDKDRADEYMRLLKVCLKDEAAGRQIREFMKGALKEGRIGGNDRISRALAVALYGSDLKCSITRLETYARCAYSHFLKYGLSLKERELFSFEAGDMGSVFHDALKEYTGILKEKGLLWTLVDKETKEAVIDEAIERCVTKGDYAALYGSFRTRYTINRMRRIVGRTVDVLTDQLKKGSFTPCDSEFDFTMGEEVKLFGRVDRMDLCSEEGTTYVKIIDYKSGSKKFDLVSIYAGLDLQLVVYMNAGIDLISHRLEGERVIPAGIFYYHIDDPVIADEEAGHDGTDDERINEKIREQLKMTGLVNSDAHVYRLMDRDFVSKSTVIPVALKKDGDFAANSSVASLEDFKIISSYVNQKAEEYGLEILDGSIKTEPQAVSGSISLPCNYCDYSDVCGYRGEVRLTDRKQITENIDEDDPVIAGGRDPVVEAMRLKLKE